MGYDLEARKRDVDDFHMGVFSYNYMMQHGVGLVAGLYPGIEKDTFFLATRKDGKDFMYSSGAYISSKEAKEMAKAARHLATSQDVLFQQFNDLDKATQESYEQQRNTYNLPIRQDFVEKFRAFADFAEKSGGFKVY